MPHCISFRPISISELNFDLILGRQGDSFIGNKWHLSIIIELKENSLNLRNRQNS